MHPRTIIIIAAIVGVILVFAVLTGIFILFMVIGRAFIRLFKRRKEKEKSWRG